MDHELALIKSFVKKGRQQRYMNLISTKKGRIKFPSYLAHFTDLDTKFCTPLPSSIITKDGLYAFLTLKGAPEICHIISESSKHDQKEFQLRDAINDLFLSGIAFFISCLPGKLGYYEGEERNSRYLLQKFN